MSSGDAIKGHRKRLRERFIRSGLKGFHDYEIIELLLTLGTPAWTVSRRPRRP